MAETKVIGLTSRAPGSRARLLFRMTHEEAMALCSDPRSKGNGWMIFFDRADLWTEANGLIPKKAIKQDNGFLDDLIDELGLTKIELN